MEQYYSTQDVLNTFNISHQTVKNWAVKFAKYLSVTARPPDGRKRIFDADDMKVFALLTEYHRLGFRHDEALIALEQGERREIPQKDDLVTAVPPLLLKQLREEIEGRDRLIATLSTERDREWGKVELLEKQLEQKDTKIEQLMETVADLKVRLKGKG